MKINFLSKSLNLSDNMIKTIFFDKNLSKDLENL